MNRQGVGISRWLGALTLAALVVCSALPLAAQDAPAKSSPEAQASYSDAAGLQNGGSFELAAEEWTKFLAKYPQDPLAAKAQYYLGVCQLQLKQYDKAAAAFAAVVKNHSKFEQLEDAYLNLGWCQYSQGAADPKQFAAAAETFTNMLKAFPMGKFTDQALYFQGEAYYQLGQKEPAVAAYDALVKGHEKSKLRADAVYALGVTQEELKQWAEAGKTYDLFLKEFAESPLVTEVRMRKAETMLQTGNVAGAEALFGEIAAIKGFAAADHALLRQAYCATQQMKDAVAAALYAKLATDFPQSAYKNEAVLSAARSYYRAKMMAEAAPLFEQVVANDPANAAEAAHWLSRIYLANKEPAKAEALAAKVIPTAGDSKYLVNLKLDQADAIYEQPDKQAQSLPLYVAIAKDHAGDELAPTALYNAAFTALAIKQYQPALTHAAAFLAAYPTHDLATDVKYVAAESNLQLGNYDAAEKGYREVTGPDVKHADLDLWRVRLGLALYLQQKYQETIDALTPIVAALQKPDHIAEAQFLIGASQFSLDKFDAAAAALTASLAANPKSTQAEEALLYLSRAQRKLDKLDDAKATLTKLIAEFPEGRLQDQAHYYLGEALAAQGDAAGAAAEYDLVVTKSPDSKFVPYALYGKALALQGAKDHAGAVAALTTLMEKSPEHELVKNGDAAFARALSRRQAKDFAGAQADIDAFLKTNPTGDIKSSALLERAMAESGAANYAAAAETLASILTENPKYSAGEKVLYELAWAYKLQNKQAEAIATFTKLATDYPAAPTVAEAQFHIAEDLYGQKKYDEAIKAFTAAKTKSDGSELNQKATYMLGWSYYQQKQYAEALAEFAAQVEKYPQGDLFADGLFMQGECLFKQQDYAKALPVLAAALKTGKLSDKVDPLVLLHAGQSAAQIKDWPQSVTYLTSLTTKYPESVYITEAQYELGWAKKNQGELDAALKDFELAATHNRGEVGARARFMIGEIYFEKKDFEEASRQYQRAMFGYGGEAAPEDVKNWQAKSGYQAARCAEVMIEGAKDAKQKADAIAQAKRFYTFVVEKHPNHELAAEAQKRLDILSKL
jgi:TolA-binding protein